MDPDHETTKLDFCSPDSHLGKVQHIFESPSNFQVKEEKNYSNRSRNNEIML